MTRFSKMHGIGNDFVVIDARDLEVDWPTLAEKICDRHFGIGSDGLILICAPEQSGDLRMRMFNPDGTEAEMCGNGIRCFAKYAIDNKVGGLLGPELLVETLAGMLNVRVSPRSDAVTDVAVGMGTPILRPSEIPIAVAELGLSNNEPGPLLKQAIQVDGVDLELTFVSMGNPHAVLFTSEPLTDFPLEALGPKIENHPLFPRRINFEVANVLNRRRLDVRVWERGAGITLACGTGACATAVAAKLNGLTDDDVDIRLPGGELRIHWAGAGEVIMTGPAELVFTGEWGQ